MKVLVADQPSDAGVAALREHVDVDVRSGLDKDQLVAVIGDYDGIVVRSATVVDADVIAAGARLRVIARAGIGLDNVDVKAATARGVLVCNAPQSNVVSAAEHTVALILSLARASRRPTAACARASGAQRLRGRGAARQGARCARARARRHARRAALRAFWHAPGRLRPVRHRRAGVPDRRRAGRHRGRGVRRRRRAHRPPAQDAGDGRGRRGGRAAGDEARRTARQHRARRHRRRGGALHRTGRGADRRRRARRVLHRADDRLEAVHPRQHRGHAAPRRGDVRGTGQSRDHGRRVGRARAAGDFVPSAVNVQIAAAIPEPVKPYLPLAETLGRLCTPLHRRSRRAGHHRGVRRQDRRRGQPGGDAVGAARAFCATSSTSRSRSSTRRCSPKSGG